MDERTQTKREWAEAWFSAMNDHIRTGNTLLVYAVVDGDDITFDTEYQVYARDCLPDDACVLDVVDDIGALGEGGWDIREDGLEYGDAEIEHWAEQCGEDVLCRLDEMITERQEEED